MSANFTPELTGYSGIQPFRFWCQKVMPLTYDDSLSYYELLCKVVDYLNNAISDLATAETNIGVLADAYDSLQGYVNDKVDELETYMNNYFNNLDVQQEINNKLDEMADNGDLTALLSPFIPDLVTSWLNANVDPVGSAVVVDSSLSITGAAADAKVTGDRLDTLDETVFQATRNKWIWGDITTNSETGRYTLNNVNIAAGTYTLTAEAIVGTQNTGSCRVVFYKTSVASGNVLANPTFSWNSGRVSKTITLAEKADIIVVQYASSSSIVGVALFKNPQLELGSTATNYIPPFTSVDYIAREDVATINGQLANIRDLIGDYTGDGEDNITIIKIPAFQHAPIVVVLDAYYEQSGTTKYPYFESYIYTDRNLSRHSIWYEIGSNVEYQIKYFRCVPYIWDNRDVYINIVVPTGCTLHIKNAYYYYEDVKSNAISKAVTCHAHDGNYNVAPEQSLNAFKMAIASGFRDGIVIPKISSDGVWFAYHDDTLESDTYLRDSNGDAPDQYIGERFSEIPWSYLSSLYIGRGKGQQFYSDKLMKLEDFLRFCAITGFDPIFSMHPQTGIQVNPNNLPSLKALVAKYGLLSRLTIKAPMYEEGSDWSLANLGRIFDTFGNDIKRYECNASGELDNPLSAITIFDAITGITVPKTIEFRSSVLMVDLDEGAAICSAVKAAGYDVSCVCDSFTENGTSMTRFTSKAMKTLIDMGVTEFTLNYHSSEGLFWM